MQRLPKGIQWYIVSISFHPVQSFLPDLGRSSATFEDFVLEDVVLQKNPGGLEFSNSMPENFLLVLGIQPVGKKNVWEPDNQPVGKKNAWEPV